MRELCKRLAHLMAMVLMSPAMLSFYIRASVMGGDRALEGSSQWLSLLPGLIGSYLRTAFYRFALAECHPTARIEFGTLFSKVGTRIRSHAYIGPSCHIGLADVGADALVAAGTQIPSGARIHGIDRLDIPIREQQGEIQRVVIGDGVWLGAGSIVMADVGAYSIVGAGSVVTRPLPARIVAAGCPATVLREREDGLKVEASYEQEPHTPERV